MTLMLASVANVEETLSLLSIGVDILDIKDPRKGALGAVDVRSVVKIIKAVSGRVPTSATIGDLPMQPELIDRGLTAKQKAGVNIVKVGIFEEKITPAVLDVFHRHAQAGTRIVLVFFADLKPVLNDFASLVDTGIYGVMLDTSNKSGGSLRSIMSDDALRSFVHASKSLGMMTGLAGSLQVNDIQPLLEMDPDFLGFRGALCCQGKRQTEIDIHAAYKVRVMIPTICNSGFSHRGVRNSISNSTLKERYGKRTEVEC